jgi:hypothetical protein
VPQEPSPKDFDTFVDFEAALKRWASVVSQLQFIPPNAKQLNELAPIAVAQEASGKNVDDSNLALPPQPKKVGLVTVDFWEVCCRKPNAAFGFLFFLTLHCRTTD